MKNLFVLLLIGLSFTSFAQETDAELTTQSDVIRNESAPGANTRARIADMYKAIIDSKVSRVGNETIDGAKTFSTSPSVPTAAPGTNTTEAASTGFVQGVNASLSSLIGTAQLNDPSLTTFTSRVTTDGGTTEAIQITYDESERLKRLGLTPDFPLFITPIGIKSGKIYAIKPVDGTGDPVFTRTGTANRVNTAGNLESVATGVPRIDYSEGNDEPVILMEPSMINMIVGAAAPVTQGVTVTAVKHTISFYGTGTIALSGTFTGSLVGTGANTRVSLVFTPTAGTLTLTISGTVTNAQLEPRDHPTSFHAGTRNSDNFTVSTINTKGFIGTNKGTFYFHIKDNTFKSRGGSNPILAVRDESTSWAFRLARVSTGSRLLIQEAQGLSSSSTKFTTTTDEFKAAITWSGTLANVFVNGLKVATFTANSTNFTILECLPTNGMIKIAALGLAPEALSDKRAIELTSMDNEVLTNAGWQQYGYFYVDNYGAVGDGVTDDTPAIQKAITEAGTNGVVRFSPNKTYLISDGLVPSNGQSWIGNGATLKRCNVRFTTLTATASAGATSITVTSASVFDVGDILSLLDNGGPHGGTGEDEDSQAVTITAINGNVITFTPALTLAVSLAGSPFPVGSEVVKIFDMVSSGGARVTYLDLTFDGNKASNNKTYSWESNYTLHHLGPGGVVQRCRFLNTPSENIVLRNNTRVIDSYGENLNGSFTHISDNEAKGNVIIAGNIIDGCSQTDFLINGHNEAAFTYSAFSFNVILANNVVRNATQSFTGNISDEDDYLIAVGNSMIGGDGVIAATSSAGASITNLKFIGNHFENVNYFHVRSNATGIEKAEGTDNIIITGNRFINTRFVILDASNVVIANNDIIVTDGYTYPATSKFPLAGSVYLMAFTNVMNVTISNNIIDSRQIASEVYTHGIYFGDGVNLKSSSGVTTAYEYTRNVSIRGNTINGFKNGISSGNPVLVNGVDFSWMNFKIEGNNIINHRTSAVFAIKAQPGMQVFNNTIIGAATYGIDVMGVASSLSTTHNGPIVFGNYIVGPATSIRIGNGNTHYNARVHNNFHSGTITDNSAGNSVSSGNFAIIAETPLIKNVREDPGFY